MLREIPVAVYILSGAGALLAGAFALPALTAGGSSSTMPGVLQSAYEAAHDAEMRYCHTAAQGLDCACFAHVSGLIIAHDSGARRLPGQIDQTTLARTQAASRC